ncbi:MAG: peptidase [Balneola sp.]
MFNAELKSNWDEDICLLIKVDNHSFNYLCECGEASNLSLKECQNTNAIFISHTHIDHFSNFDTVLRSQLGIGRTVTIVGPQGITGQVQHRIKSYCWNLIKEDSICYEIREVVDRSTYISTLLKPPLWEKTEIRKVNDLPVFEEDSFVVEFEILDHKTDSISYLFKGKQKTKIQLPDELNGGKWVRDLKLAFANNEPTAEIEIDGKVHQADELFQYILAEDGYRLGVIMDHSATKQNHDKIKRLFSNADIVFIESFYLNEEKELAQTNYHSYAAKSGNIMKSCNIKHAIPVHFSRKYRPEDIDKLHDQFNEAYLDR